MRFFICSLLLLFICPLVLLSQNTIDVSRGSTTENVTINLDEEIIYTVALGSRNTGAFRYVDSDNIVESCITNPNIEGSSVRMSSKRFTFTLKVKESLASTGMHTVQLKFKENGSNRTITLNINVRVPKLTITNITQHREVGKSVAALYITKENYTGEVEYCHEGYIWQSSNIIEILNPELPDNILFKVRDARNLGVKVEKTTYISKGIVPTIVINSFTKEPQSGSNKVTVNISVTNITKSDVEYSINGIDWQDSNIFNIPNTDLPSRLKFAVRDKYKYGVITERTEFISRGIEVPFIEIMNVFQNSTLSQVKAIVNADVKGIAKSDLRYKIKGIGNWQTSREFLFANNTINLPKNEIFQVKDINNRYPLQEYLTTINRGISSQLEINKIELVYYFCGTRANILLRSYGSGLQNLRYSKDNIHWQSSSSFDIQKTIGQSSYTFYVKDLVTNTVVSMSKEIIFKELTVDVKTDSERPNCGEAKGKVDATVSGGWRYLKFEQGSDYVEIPAQYLIEETQFTMEGDIRLTESLDDLKRSGGVGVFGIDNTAEFGFQGGRPAGWMFTGSGHNLNYSGSKYFPDDHEWHNIVLRYDGKKMQILVDGNEFESIDVDNQKLISESYDKNVTIGANVWGTGARSMIGDISRVTFWNKALTNEELSNLRENPPTGNEPHLLAAYTMHKRKDGVLEGVKGETGVMHGVEWSDRLTYHWYEVDKIDENTIIKDLGTNSKLEDLPSGKYKLEVKYLAGSCGEKSYTYIFDLEDKKDLVATIDATQKGEFCNPIGNVLFSSKVIGGIAGKIYTYQWEKSTDNKSFTSITGKTFETMNSVPNSGANYYRLKVTSGNCDVESDVLIINIGQPISTGRITRKN